MQAMWSIFWKHKVQSAVFNSLPVERIRNCRQNCAKKVRPQRVAAHRQQELLCVKAFQELEWHAIDDMILRVVLKAWMSYLQKMEPRY